MARRNDHSPEELKRIALDAARVIATADGLRGLTVRRVAEAIGYAPGTLYNLFANLDDLIVQLNGETLEALGARLGQAAGGAVDERPRRLIDAYFDFVEGTPRLWAVLFEHRLPEGVDLPDWYRARLDGLIGGVAAALGPALAAWPEPERRAAVVAMWAGLHGIATLAVSSKLTLVAATEPRALGRLLVERLIAAGPPPT